MRTPRLILDPDACAYHCIARTSGQVWLFDSEERRSRIQQIIYAAAQLKGADILNFTILSNHIHILVKFPEPEAIAPLTKTSLLQCARHLYRPAHVAGLEADFAAAEKLDKDHEDSFHTNQILAGYEAQRGNLSLFMGEVKERITHYINKQHKRKGTLWEGRFKSVVVENTPKALLAVSTYIDLNAVRAGIVDRPEDYRWCGYAAALGGDTRAREGLASLYGHRGGAKPKAWRSIAADYRQFLYESGEPCDADPSKGTKARRGISKNAVHKEISRRGRMPLHEVMHYRVRYFTDGVIIGSRSFIDNVFNEHRERLIAPGSQRETGARPMRRASWAGLCSFRDLRLNVISQLGT